VLLVVLTASVFSQKPGVVTSNSPGWKKIGETTASFQSQNESIAVLGADEFSAIKLKVTNAPIEIERLQVFYESGDMEDIDVGNQLQAGAETRSISLKNPTRDIQKIAFTYKTMPNYKGEKAHVELLGLKTVQQGKSDAYHNDNKDKKDHDLEEVTEETAEDAEQAVERTEKVEGETDDARRNTRTGIEKVGDEISETANKAVSAIKDQLYVGKMGPAGQSIYIDNNDKYYYINEQGKKVYVSKSQLKDRPQRD
jgi:vacuolar-type H+-ATPase subunit H